MPFQEVELMERGCCSVADRKELIGGVVLLMKILCFDYENGAGTCGR
jgi:hypothetical protein